MKLCPCVPTPKVSEKSLTKHLCFFFHTKTDIMKLEAVLAFLKRAFTPISIKYDDDHAAFMVGMLKSSSNELHGVDTLKEDSTAALLTKEQRMLLIKIDPKSDMADHVPSYDEEECQWIQRLLTAIEGMTDVQARDEDYVKSVLPEIDKYMLKENAPWAKNGNHTVIQVMRSFRKEKPIRLVHTPLSVVKTHLELILRHQNKPFASAHMTVRDPSILVKYLDKTRSFVVSIWIGPPGGKITEAGTGFRSPNFIGIAEEKTNIVSPFPLEVGQTLSYGGRRGSVARVHEDGTFDLRLDLSDKVNRLLSFQLPAGKVLREAYEDFERAYTSDDPRATVPVLLQLEHFTTV